MDAVCMGSCCDSFAFRLIIDYRFCGYSRQLRFYWGRLEIWRLVAFSREHIEQGTYRKAVHRKITAKLQRN